MVSLSSRVCLCVSASPSSQLSGEGDWEHGEESVRRATFTNSREGGSAGNSPVLVRRETVGEDILTESDRMKVFTIHTSVSSIWNASC